MRSRGVLSCSSQGCRAPPTHAQWRQAPTRGPNWAAAGVGGPSPSMHSAPCCAALLCAVYLSVRRCTRSMAALRCASLCRAAVSAMNNTGSGGSAAWALTAGDAAASEPPGPRVLVGQGLLQLPCRFQWPLHFAADAMLTRRRRAALVRQRGVSSVERSGRRATYTTPPGRPSVIKPCGCYNLQAGRTASAFSSRRRHPPQGTN